MRGRDLVTGLPKSVEVGSRELRAAIAGPTNLIVEAVKLSLEKHLRSYSPTSWSTGSHSPRRGATERYGSPPGHGYRYCGACGGVIRCSASSTGAAICLEEMDIYRSLFTSENAPRLRL